MVMGMANFVLVAQAVEHSDYTVEHIRYLVRNALVKSQKVGRIWLVDLDANIPFALFILFVLFVPFNPPNPKQEKPP